MNDYQTRKAEVALVAFIAVVEGTAAGQANLPAAQNAAGFCGFTADKAAIGESVSVVRGRCRATAAGAITRGDWVRIAGNTGKIESCQALVDSAPGAAS